MTTPDALRTSSPHAAAAGTAAAVAAFLEQARAAQTEFLAELVRVPSDNPPGDCAPHAARAAALLEALGFVVERHAVPADIARENGMVSVTNLVVREHFGAGPVIALNAHGDVVPPGLGWSVDPYGASVVAGTMYGRGVAVSKSDFATYAYALLALKKTGARLNGTVELHLTYDEETGGALGPAWLLGQGISKPDYVISAGFSYGVVTAHNGCLHLEVELVGKSAHAARPETGIDALAAATGVLAHLYAMAEALGAVRSGVDGIASPTMIVGLIAGGINTNVVPDRVSFRLDRRIIPEESPAEVEATLQREIARAAAAYPGAVCTVRRILLAVPFTPIAGQEKLVLALTRNARRVFGVDVKPHGVPIFTDARLYSGAGIPTVLYGAGPRTVLEANGHRADEKLVLDDLYKATEVVAASLADLLA